MKLPEIKFLQSAVKNDNLLSLVPLQKELIFKVAYMVFWIMTEDIFSISFTLEMFSSFTIFAAFFYIKLYIVAVVSNRNLESDQRN